MVAHFFRSGPLSRPVGIITVIIIEIIDNSQSPFKDLYQRLARPFIPPDVKARFAIG